MNWLNWLTRKDSHFWMDLNESTLLNESLNEWLIDSLIKTATCFFFFFLSFCSWVLNEWLNDSFVKTVTCKFINESAFLNESLEWMTQWLTHKHSHLFCSGMSQWFWTIGGVNDSSNDLTVIYVTCMHIHY